MVRACACVRACVHAVCVCVPACLRTCVGQLGVRVCVCVSVWECACVRARAGLSETVRGSVAGWDFGTERRVATNATESAVPAVGAPPYLTRAQRA